MRHGRRRSGRDWGKALAGALLIAVLCASGAWPWRALAQAGCSKAQFERVVDEAAEALRALNAKNRPAFQDKLRQLKEKRGWSHAEFLSNGAPFVQDEKISAFDQSSGELLAKITTMGEAGAAAATPDCKLLGELHETMKSLVDTQANKWMYMFEKLDAAIKE